MRLVLEALCAPSQSTLHYLGGRHSDAPRPCRSSRPRLLTARAREQPCRASRVRPSLAEFSSGPGPLLIELYLPAVLLPYSWGLVEGEDRQVRLPPLSTSVFEPVGRETAYSAAAQVKAPPNIGTSTCHPLSCQTCS